MARLQRALIWLAGHQPSLLDDEAPQDRLAVAKIGSAVLFAALVASASWATAAFVLGEGLAPALRWLAAVAAAVVGGSMVMLFDRYFVYLSDTVEFSRWGLGAYIAARLVVVLVTSTITSYAIIPLVLRAELQATALQMTDASEGVRRTALAAQFDIGGKAKALDTSVAAAQLAAAEVQQTPPEVARIEDQARRCVARREQAARDAAGDDSDATAQRLASLRSQCQHLAQAARLARAEHLARAREQLAQASQRQTEADATLTLARDKVDARVDQARVVEAEAFTPQSATVLFHLLRTDPAAFIKWLMVTLLLFILETLALWLKGLAGRSVPGVRICVDTAQRLRRIQERDDKARFDFEASQAVSGTARDAMTLALQSPVLLGQFRAAFEQQMAALAPLEVVSSLMTELGRRQDNLEDFVRQYPRYASIATEAWSAAFLSAISALRASVQPQAGVAAAGAP